MFKTLFRIEPFEALFGIQALEALFGRQCRQADLEREVSYHFEQSFLGTLVQHGVILQQVRILNLL